MNERALRFGPDGSLVGILTAPTEPAPGVQRAVLMSNIGMHHRVGPFRIYVDLARALAAAGFHVLRFDMSGMGDSEQRHDVAGAAERSRADLDDAMQLLARELGIVEFVLIGLCSGVDSTHSTATHDARVRGAVFIDGYSYPTTGFLLRHYLVRPTQGERWMRYFQRRLRQRPAVDDGTSVFVREYPSREQFGRDIAQLTQRGAHVMFVYSGGMYHRVNSPAQLFEMVGSNVVRDRVTVRTMYAADHVFTSVARRAELVSAITEWVTALPR